MAELRSWARYLIDPSADWAGSEAPAANRIMLCLVRPGAPGSMLAGDGGAGTGSALASCWLGVVGTKAGAALSPAAPGGPPNAPLAGGADATLRTGAGAALMGAGFAGAAAATARRGGAAAALRGAARRGAFLPGICNAIAPLSAGFCPG